MNAARSAMAATVCAALVAAVACGSGPGKGAQSEVTVTYTVSPDLNGTLYQVQSDTPINSDSLTSEEFRQELVQASADCDPGGSDRLSRRLTLTQSGEFDTYTQAGVSGGGVKLEIHIAAGPKSPDCANTAADNAVKLLRRSNALRPLREIEDASHLELTGSVTQRVPTAR